MYDNICKFLAETFTDDFASWLLGSPVRLTELSPNELSLEPIRADSLILQQTDDLVLHAEFQTEPDPEMPFRMIDYRLRVYRRFPQKEMRQIVIYLNRTNSQLVRQTSFSLSRTSHEFDVIRLWEQPPEIFLASPGLLPFAALSRTEDPTTVLNQVASAVEGISDRRVQSNVAASAAVLAALVLDREVIRRILRREIMRESAIYQEILQEGRDEGIEVGIEVGRQEGIEVGRQEGITLGIEQVAANMIRAGFAPEDVARATGLSLPDIESIGQAIAQQNEG